MAGGQYPNLTTQCLRLSERFFIFKVLAKVVPITMDIGYTTKSNPHLNGAHGFCPQSHRNTATFVPIITILSQSPSPCQPLLTIFFARPSWVHTGHKQVSPAKKAFGKCQIFLHAGCHSCCLANTVKVVTAKSNKARFEFTSMTAAAH